MNCAEQLGQLTIMSRSHLCDRVIVGTGIGHKRFRIAADDVHNWTRFPACVILLSKTREESPRLPMQGIDPHAPVVRFHNVGMRYGNGPEILRDISFSLARGAFCFLTGESGAGKSSLLKLLYLAERPSRGVTALFGRDLVTVSRSELPHLRRSIGVVFQDFRLINHLTALENVALPLRVGGARSSDLNKHVADLLRWVGLANHIDSYPATLSGGEQQRVAIARAVINRPSLLVADEPTGNVDDTMAMRLMYLFEELNRMGTTVVVATHNEQLVAKFDYPRLLLANGHLVRDGS
jgi:cell division transport system ATP-binding protein